MVGFAQRRTNRSGQAKVLSMAFAFWQSNIPVFVSVILSFQVADMVSCVEEASGETCAGVCREARAGFDGDPSGGVLGAIVVARIKCLHSYVETTSVRGVKKLMSITGWELFMLRMWPSHKVCSMKLLLLLIDTSPPRHLPISRLC